ncbi:GNAT family N-acetyltransferase [Micromonosporaceae bacterium Da 78-11]
MTARLLLRPFRSQDWGDVHRYGTDPEVVRFMDWGPNTPDETTVWLDRMIDAYRATPRTQFPFAVQRSVDGRLVGSVELQIESAEHGRGEMGYVMSRDAWGHGYATEAAAALLRFGFEQLGLRRISATCDPENVGSSRVLEKIGMTFEGRLRSYFTIRGEQRDRLLYAAVTTPAGSEIEDPPGVGQHRR